MYFYTPAFYDGKPTTEKWNLCETTKHLYKKGFAFETEEEAQIQAENFFWCIAERFRFL